MYDRNLCQISILIDIHIFIFTFSLFINKFQTKVCAIPCQLETVLRGAFEK